MRRKWGWAAATGGGVATLAGLAAYGAVGPSSQLFGPYRSKGDPRSEAIALTFDDGPSESTPMLLDYLESEHVPATFFQCGMNVARLPNIARQVAGTRPSDRQSYVLPSAAGDENAGVYRSRVQPGPNNY